MLGKYEGIKKEIRQIYDNGQLGNCITEINKFLNVLNNKQNDMEDQRDLRFCYFMMAKCYKNLNKYKMAIMYSFKSLELSILDTDKTMTYWLMATCYENTNDETSRIKAIDYYNKCIEYYHEDKNNLIYELCIRSNKAVLENNEIEIFRIINQYINTYKKDVDMNVVDGMYENLYKIQCKNKEFNKAKLTLNRIKNNALKENLSNEVFA